MTIEITPHYYNGGVLMSRLIVWDENNWRRETYNRDGKPREIIHVGMGKLDECKKKKRDKETQSKETPSKDKRFEKQYFWHENGQMKQETTLVNDRKHGVERWFHENGTLAAEHHYKNGYPDGKYKIFNENGEMTEHGRYYRRQRIVAGVESPELKKVIATITATDATLNTGMN